jgi:hypothetical protein
MGRSRREQIVAGVLVVLMAGFGYRAWRGTAGPSARASNPSAAATRAARAQTPLEAPDVHLRALDGEAPAPTPGGRDLFQFGERERPAEPAVRAPATEAEPVRPVPSEPRAAGTTLIGLKFIGIVEAPDSNARIAILSDGRGAPLYGREGDTIAGRYRILHIGTESIEMAYLDGRGRQAIRLSGS